MKMRNHILRMVSVFFLVLVLGGCGIATYINIESSFIKKSDNTSEITIEYTVTNYSENLSLVSIGGGPSLMLCYAVTNRKDIPSFNSYFKTKYQRNNIGIPLSTPNIVSYTSESVEYTLYQFSDSNGTEFKAPGYYALANDPINPQLQFKIGIGVDSNSSQNKVINFTQLVGSYTLQGLPVLRRYDGTPFESTISTILSDRADYPDYSIEESEGSLFLHIFAAASITKGDFNNIYWSDLAHLCYFQIN